VIRRPPEAEAAETVRGQTEGPGVPVEAVGVSRSLISGYQSCQVGLDGGGRSIQVDDGAHDSVIRSPIVVTQPVKPTGVADPLRGFDPLAQGCRRVAGDGAPVRPAADGARARSVDAAPLRVRHR
jgi:hypothetical protein